MKKIIFILLITGFIITGCSKNVEHKTDAVRFQEEYENLNGIKKDSGTGVYSTISIPEDNAIVYSNEKEILSLLENGTGIIYFGSPRCPWCRSMISTLLNTANMVGIDKIYYFDATKIRDIKHLDESGNIVTDQEGTQEYYDLLNSLDSVLPPYKELQNDDIKRLYFPTVVFVKEGQILEVHMKTVESQQDPDVLLNEKEEKELSQIYSTYMHEVLGDVCDQSC